MLNTELPARETWPKTSAVCRKVDAEPDAEIAGVAGLVGQKVPARPCSVPLAIKTGTPVPPPTLRKFTFSMNTPEPAPVLVMFKDELAPVA